MVPVPRNGSRHWTVRSRIRCVVATAVPATGGAFVSRTVPSSCSLSSSSGSSNSRTVACTEQLRATGTWYVRNGLVRASCINSRKKHTTGRFSNDDRPQFSSKSARLRSIISSSSSYFGVRVCSCTAVKCASACSKISSSNIYFGVRVCSCCPPLARCPLLLLPLVGVLIVPACGSSISF